MSGRSLDADSQLTALAMLLCMETFLSLRSRVEVAATAEPAASDGKPSVRLQPPQEKDGVRTAGRLAGLPPGIHALHVHATGQCYGSYFKSSRAHFSPYGRKRGLQNKDGPNAEDLPTFTVAPGGSAEINGLTARATESPTRRELEQSASPAW